MEGIVVLAITVAAIVVLDLAAFAFGRDSRETFETGRGILV
ncbi:MAG TPA: hypothetical protein VGO64_11635 [Candidatus Limnocylindrales bacterium]|nr:hypothetical protein [Candidatus Limnocylindrales bacterium]